MPIVYSKAFNEAIKKGATVEQAIKVSSTDPRVSGLQPLVRHSSGGVVVAQGGEVYESTKNWGGSSLNYAPDFNYEKGYSPSMASPESIQKREQEIQQEKQRQQEYKVLQQKFLEQKRVGNFSGQVEVRAPSQKIGGGRLEETQYYVKGKQVGRTYQTPQGEYAEVSQPSRLKFNQGTTQTTVQLQPKQISIEQQYVTQQDVSNIIASGSKEIIFQKPISEIQPLYAPSEKGFFGTLSNWNINLGFTQSRLQTAGERNKITIPERVELFGIGAGQVALGTILGTKELVLHPIKTILGIPSFVKQEVTTLGTSLASPTPEYAMGRIAGYYATSKGIGYSGKGIVKIADLTRTKGTINIPMEDVVAPEYIAGQRYPAIAKGETAGQLLKEFTGVKEVYGVTQLKGFTAAPKPFAKTTEIGGGSSEIAGVYQAPKLSPAFLRIASEEQTAFTLNPFGTLRPSITKITPQKFELVKGLRYSQKDLMLLGKAKRFIETKGTLGKSYIPFVKTEKEAIIPEGTPLVLTAKRFAIKFEGRKIPIYEFDIGDLTKVTKETKIYSPKEIIKISSYRVGKRGIYSPYDILKLPKYKSYGGGSKGFSYSSITSPISSSVSTSYKSSLTSPLKSYGKSTTSNINSYASRVYGSISKGYGYGGRSYGGGGSSYYNPPIPPRFPPPVPPRRYNYYSHKQSKGFGLFPVLLRRFGKFKIIGFGRTPLAAFSIGKEAAESTLGATFKVPGIKPFSTPRFKTKISKKEGLVFIQIPKYRLSRKTEVKEINLYKSLKFPMKKRRK